MERTSITIQLKSTVNCSVSMPAKCESDNLITHYEQGCSVNADNNKLQTWPEIKTNLKSLTLTSEYWIPVDHRRDGNVGLLERRLIFLYMACYT